MENKKRKEEGVSSIITTKNADENKMVLMEKRDTVKRVFIGDGGAGSDNIDPVFFEGRKKKSVKRVQL